MNDALDLRFDARHLIVPDRTLDGATSDFEVTAGVSRRSGLRFGVDLDREPLRVAGQDPPYPSVLLGAGLDAPQKFSGGLTASPARTGAGA